MGCRCRHLLLICVGEQPANERLGVGCGKLHVSLLDQRAEVHLVQGLRVLFGKQPLVAHVLAQAVADGAETLLGKLRRRNRKHRLIDNPCFLKLFLAWNRVVLVGGGGSLRPTVHVFP